MELRGITKSNRKIISDIKRRFRESKLGPRIVCLIVHGSSLFYPLDSNSDVDLEMILKNPQEKDYKIIKEIISQTRVKIECQLRYLKEIETKKSLIAFSSYKVFMYLAYANGVCLLGRNIYKDLTKTISDEAVKKSLLISAQIYFKDIRKSFFRGADPYWVNKNVGYALLDVCLSEGFLDYRQLGKKVILKEEKLGFTRPILKNYSLFLNEKDKKILRDFSAKYRKGEIFERVFPVINKIFAIFEKRLIS